MAVPITLKIPLQIAEGANRRRKLVLTPGFDSYRARTSGVMLTKSRTGIERRNFHRRVVLLAPKTK